MSQISPRFCPQCNSPVASGQRFCPNCGAVLPSEPISPTVAAMPGNQSGQYGVPRTELASQPPPPPPSTSPDYMTPPPSTGPNYAMPSSSSYPSYPGQTPVPAPPSPYTSYPPQTPYVGGAIPPYAPQSNAQPKKNSKALLFAIIAGVLVLVLVVGGIAAAVLASHSSKNNNNTAGTTTGGNTGSGSGSSSGNSGSSGSLTQSEQLNLSVTYSSVIMTFTSVQQADNFSDDSYITQPGVVRVNFKEQNTTTNPSFYTYIDAFRLILPDGSTVVAPINSQSDIGPDQSVTRTNWVDFPVASKVDLGKLTLQLGASGEVTMAVPLNPSADLSKYQPKTYTPKASTNYAGLSWTVTSVVVSLSADGNQAKTGDEYVTVNLTVSNPTGNDFFGFDYMRLQSSGSTVTATDGSQGNEPGQVSAGTTNVKGSATFLMPNTDTSFTLIFLAQDQISQTSTTFTLS